MIDILLDTWLKFQFLAWVVAFILCLVSGKHGLAIYSAGAAIIQVGVMLGMK